MVQRAKAPVFSLPWLWSLLWHRFNAYAMRVAKKERKKKKKRNSSISQLLGADAHAFARISFFLEGDGRCLGVRNSIPQALQFPELHFEPMLRSESSPTRPDKHCGPSLRLPAIIK